MTCSVNPNSCIRPELLQQDPGIIWCERRAREIGAHAHAWLRKSTLLAFLFPWEAAAPCCQVPEILVKQSSAKSVTAEVRDLEQDI